MPDVPANFFTRVQLQGLVLKASGLLHDTPCEAQRIALFKLMQAAAELEGVLADLPVSSHPNCKALDNPNKWTSEWLDNTLESGSFTIHYGQQILRGPVGGQPHYIANGRYRLTLGDVTHTSSDVRKLRSLLVSHLAESPGVEPEAKAFILDHLFTEGADAVQVESTAA